MTFLKHYLQVFLPLFAAYTIYATLVVPRIEPTVHQQASRWGFTSLPKSKEGQWWESYFREDAWQRQNPLMIQRDKSLLLYQKREQLSDTRWRFSPLTIIIPQESQGGSRRAIFIENPKGAEIQFKSAFDWTSGHPPPVLNGQLSGEIQIYSPADQETGEGELLIQTQDVRIDRRQIWTDKQIKMKIGGSKIEGRYLSIFMDQDLLAESASASTSKPNDSPFAGLDYLQLFYVDHVRLELQKGGLWPSQNENKDALGAAYATLDCRGRFQFQFHQAQATFMDGVHMEHVVEGKPADTFDCNELRLTVGWKTPAAAPANASPAAVAPVAPLPIASIDQVESKGVAASQGSADSGVWRLQRLEALGLPGRDANDQSRWIRLKAPGMDAQADGQHLVMDMVHGMVSLSNVLPGSAPKNSSQVFLKRGNIQVSSPNIQYQNPEILNSEKRGEFQRLGWVLADGIGQAQIASEEGEIWNLRWSNRLTIRPHEQRDLISIDGGANISSSQRGRFVAEKLHLWVLPTDAAMAQRLADFYPPGQVPKFFPDAISAQGQVIVNAPELNAQVESMAVRFRHLGPQEAMQAGYSVADSGLRSSQSQPLVGAVSPTATANPNAPLIANTPLSPNASVNSTGIEPPMLRGAPRLGAAAAGQGSGGVAGNVSGAGRKSPMSVTGKTLDTDIVRVGTQSIIESLSLDGNFTLTREFLSEDSPWPLTATGDRLVIQSESTELSNVYLVGEPARIAVGSGWVVAKELQLSQNDQLFWINHPGEIVIPEEALASDSGVGVASGGGLSGGLSVGGIGSSGGQVGQKFDWKSAPRIQWGERMTFDGRIARFGGGVTLDCKMQSDASTLWHMLATARTLSMDMSERVAFQVPRGGSSQMRGVQGAKPQVQVVRLDGEVDIKAVQTDLGGIRRSAENLQVPRLEFQVPSRTWIGYGPGQLWSRRHSNDTAMGIGGFGGNASASSQALQCLHLTFVGRMEGSMPQRIVSFYDKIAALMGPIATWEDFVDVRNAERLLLHQTRLVCDQLNLFDASSLSYNQQRLSQPNGTWEIDALGAAQLTSRTDSGEIILDASRIGYAAAQDAVRIEGTAQRAANIRRVSTENPAQAGQTIQVSSASIRLKTGQIDAQIRKIEGALPSNLQPSAGPASPSGGPAAGAGSSRPDVLPSARDFNPFAPRSGPR